MKEAYKVGALETRKTNKKENYFVVGSIILLFITACYALIEGAMPLTIREIWQALFGEAADMTEQIIFSLRLPRIIIGIVVGVCLGMSGAILQGVMRNPLADPGIIGVSAGASLVAVIILMMFPALLPLLPILTFIGGLVTVAIIYSLAWKGGASPIRIILSGVAMNAFIGAIVSTLMLLYSERVQAVLPWMTGGIGGSNWEQIRNIIPYAVVGVIAALAGIPRLKALLLGDDVAKLLGHNVERSRIYLVSVSAFLAGIAVSVSGLIGFVGLVIPHIVRLLIGTNYRYLLPLSGILGAVLVIFADTIARSWFDPIELQLGILLSLLGGPFFLYLLQKGGGKFGGGA